MFFHGSLLRTSSLGNRALSAAGQDALEAVGSHRTDVSQQEDLIDSLHATQWWSKRNLGSFSVGYISISRGPRSLWEWSSSRRDRYIGRDALGFSIHHVRGSG